MCPKGDDPLTINQNYRTFQLTVKTSDNSFTGSLTLKFEGGTASFSLANPSSTDCRLGLENSGLFGYINCQYSYITSYSMLFTITIYSWPIYPQQNNLHSHDGNPLISEFYCDVTSTSSKVSCEFYDVINSNLIEYDYCSNRGNCNFITGLCSCDSGYGGPACSNLTYTYQTNSNALPGLHVLTNEIDYVGSALEINTVKSAASDFYFIEAIANNEQIFYVRGDGLVGIPKLQTLTGGHTITGGGLYITSGGCTILTDGLSVTTSHNVNQIASFNSQSASTLNSSFSVVKIESSSTSSSFFLLTASNQDTKRFDIQSDGQVHIYQGGLHVTDGITINTIGLYVNNGGITVNSGGLKVSGGGLNVAGGGQIVGGLNINSGGVKIINSGLQVYAGGVSIYSGGLRVNAGGASMFGGLHVTGGLTVNNGGSLSSCFLKSLFCLFNSSV